ncbi:type II toxin-antitoxin system RelE/ParE family toxin [Embleya sp. AB8]|uniref:type II toxin-antitoxin system RelE/ParE family toxin n=1 Tax=Embleya sp. AB8 TaxID=3156304 RepID=UPI003C71C02F
MSYSVKYSPDCDKIRSQLSSSQRASLDRGVALIAGDPYGSATSEMRDRDHRQASAGDFIVVYQVTAEFLFITVVRIV